MVTPSPVVTAVWRDVMERGRDYGVTFGQTKQSLLTLVAQIEEAFDTWLASQPGDPKLVAAVLYELLRRRLGR